MYIPALLLSLTKSHLINNNFRNTIKFIVDYATKLLTQSLAKTTEALNVKGEKNQNKTTEQVS